MEENTNLGFSKEKIWSILCYIPFVNLIFTLLASVKFADNQAIRFHVRQGLVLFLISFFSLLLVLVSYSVGVFFLLLLLIFHSIEIVAVFTDTYLILPGIGQVCMKIPEFFLYRLLTGKDPSETWVSKE